MDEKLEYFKKKILAHLDDLEQKETAEKKELKKSLIAFEMTSIEKAGYPVGTIREWKGKKYIKVAPGKWKPKYDSHSRGAKMAIAALKKKIDACTDSEELMQIILENRDRFSDGNGRPLPFVKELSDYISERNDNIENTKAESKKQAEKTEIEKLLKEVNPNGGADRGFQFGVEDLEHLKNIKKMIDDYEKNPVREHEREFEEAKIRQYGRESKRLQKIYNETGDKGALEGAWKNLDFMHFHQWQIAKLDKAKYSKDFNNLTDALKNGKDFTISTNKYFGDVLVESGETGKSGYGLKHIIEQRFKKDGKSVDEITAMIPLTLDSVRDGKITRETGRTIEIQKNGIVAILRKQPNDKGTNWILTGFENTDDVKEKNKAEDVIATVIANKDYAPERSSFREQVGAITASLENIPQNGEKSSGSADFKGTNIEKAIEKYASDTAVKNARKKADVDNFCSDDENRFFMNGVYYDEGKKVATNGRYLLIEEVPYPENYEGKIISSSKSRNKKLLKWEEKKAENDTAPVHEPIVAEMENGDVEIYGRFPNYKKVIPDTTGDNYADSTDLVNGSIDKIEKMALLGKKMKDKDSPLRIKIGNQFFDSSLLSEIISYARSRGGLTSVKFSKDTKACTFEGKNFKAVIMPSQYNEENSYLDVESGNFVGEQSDRVKAFLSGEVKKSFDLFGNEIKDFVFGEENDSEDEGTENAIKKAVAEVLALIA